jgi:arsenate reductase (thioredoxin)
MNVLFMCVANSGRSQMAEAIGRKVFGEDARIESAGSEPKTINPLTAKVLLENEMDISGKTAKSCEQLSTHFLDNLDYVITLCAEEVCPVLTNSETKRLHWPTQDPAAATGSDEEKLRVFREVRDQLQSKIEQFASEIRSIPDVPVLETSTV